MHRSKILAGLFSNAYVNAHIGCNDGRELQDEEIVAMIALLDKQSIHATSQGCEEGYLSNSLHHLSLSIKGADGAIIKSLPIFSAINATRIPGSISFSYELEYNPEYIYLTDLLEKKIVSHQKQQSLVTPLLVIPPQQQERVHARC